MLNDMLKWKHKTVIVASLIVLTWANGNSLSEDIVYSLAVLELITCVPAIAIFFPWCFGYWQVFGACQYFPKVQRRTGKTVIFLIWSSVSSNRPALASIRSISQTFSLDRWWFIRCELMSALQLFKHTKSAPPPRLLPNFRPVIAEKKKCSHSICEGYPGTM